ncbi:MAG: dTDP-4-dehydrorhamnose 3,5-epimerase [Candidatus Omnitrophota bacterium]|jgi:dTDP-4-dehydrorhamnose 3,5-epimerase
MKFYKQKIPGVFLIEAEPFKDSRGMFFRHFCKKEFESNGLEARILQTNVSQNSKSHTLRGMHYQLKPYSEHKTMLCISGAIYDIIVDLRPDSATFLKWISVELNAEEPVSLHLPAGCANGYLTLKDDTSILYYMSEYYVPEAYKGLRYNDPMFKFTWPVEPRVISEKDRSYPDFDPQIVSKAKNTF